MSVGTHVSHCCRHHGCKYGENETCPVVLGTHKQKYPCETCGMNEHPRDEEADDPNDPYGGYFDGAMRWHPKGEIRNDRYEYVTRLGAAAWDTARRCAIPADEPDRELVAMGFERIAFDATVAGVLAVYRRERGRP